MHVVCMCTRLRKSEMVISQLSKIWKFLAVLITAKNFKNNNCKYVIYCPYIGNAGKKTGTESFQYGTKSLSSCPNNIFTSQICIKSYICF